MSVQAAEPQKHLPTCSCALFSRSNMGAYFQHPANTSGSKSVPRYKMVGDQSGGNNGFTSGSCCKDAVWTFLWLKTSFAEGDGKRDGLD